MAKTTTRLKHRKSRRRGAPGLHRGLVVIVVLLAAAALAAWYYRLNLSPRPSPTAASAPVPKKDAKAASKASEEAAQAAAEADRFQFYDMLPDAKVTPTEQPKSAGPAAPPPITAPGTYVVQAGAFPDFAAADKVKARLALLGVVSEIQVADANGARFHRVRIGPVDSLADLNRVLGRLRQSGIEYQVIPVGE